MTNMPPQPKLWQLRGAKAERDMVEVSTLVFPIGYNDMAQFYPSCSGMEVKRLCPESSTECSGFASGRSKAFSIFALVMPHYQCLWEHCLMYSCVHGTVFKWGWGLHVSGVSLPTELAECHLLLVVTPFIKLKLGWRIALQPANCWCPSRRANNFPLENTRLQVRSLCD